MPSLNATCQQANKSANYGTGDGNGESRCHCAKGNNSNDIKSIKLLHSEEATRLLDDNNGRRANNWTYHSVACAGRKLLEEEEERTSKQVGASPCKVFGAHFRYFVAFLILLAVTVNGYANYTMYIAAIEMISNDVISSRLTELRREHMSRDPRMIGRDAAPPGTCPVGTDNLAAIARLKQTLGNQQAASSTMTTTTTAAAGLLGANLTAIGLQEQEALALDTLALFASVHERLAAGKLVDWSISQRAYIFTAHNFGGILLALPISRLGLVYGSKRIIGVCLALAGARMLLLPWMAGAAPYWLMFLFEFLLGAPGSCVGILAYPLAAAWLLPDEANFFVALGQFAQLIGNALTNFVSTQLLTNNISWPWCYYLPGICLGLLTLLWMAFGDDSPNESRFTLRQERELIRENSLATVNHLKLLAERQQNDSHQHQCICSNLQADCPANKLVRRPNWCVIFTCPTVWALIMVFFAYHWNAKVATLWPTFFANILHMDASAIGILTGLKGVMALVFGSAFAFLTRKFACNRPFNISLTAYRRTNQLLATLVMAASVGLMCLMDCNVWAMFASVMLTPVISSFNAISHEQMPLDLSAEDSGLLVSVIRLLSIGDLLALPVSSYVLSFAPVTLGGATGDRQSWRLVWLLGLLVKMFAAGFFVLVAKSKPKRYSRLESSGPCKTIGRLSDLQWSARPR